jgi:hypothetical protein
MEISPFLMKNNKIQTTIIRDNTNSLTFIQSLTLPFDAQADSNTNIKTVVVLYSSVTKSPNNKIEGMNLFILVE